MTCRSCGTVIADRAIVCYKCGVPASDPVAPTPKVARRQPSWGVPLAVLLVLWGSGWFAGPTARWVLLVLGLATIALAVRRVLKR